MTAASATPLLRIRSLCRCRPNTSPTAFCHSVSQHPPWARASATSMVCSRAFQLLSLSPMMHVHRDTAVVCNRFSGRLSTVAEKSTL